MAASNTTTLSRKEYNKKYKLHRKRAWLAEHGPCNECGSHSGLVLLRADRSMLLGDRIWTHSEEKRMAALEGCTVLCRRCVAKRVIIRSRYVPPAPAIGLDRKRCTRCLKVKPLAQFGLDSDGKDGKRNECKRCRRRAYAFYQPRYKEKVRLERLKRVFGLSPDEERRLLRVQRGVCAICKQPERVMLRGAKPRLSVDHDHKLGKPRGLLCRRCNAALGNFNDSEELLKAAISYLRRWRKHYGLP